MVTEAQLKQKAKANLKHGAAAGERAITTGASLTGMAQVAENAVADELVTQGITAIVIKRATRLQAVSDLYYQAILGATDLDRLDVLVKRYGWLQASSLRAWLQVREMEKDNGSKTRAIDVLNAVRGDNGQDS